MIKNLIDKLKSIKLRRRQHNNNSHHETRNHFLDSPIKNIRLVNLEFVGKIIDIDDTKVNSGIPLIKLNISQVELKASRVELSNSIDSIKIELKEDLNRRLSNIVSDKLKSKE